MAVLPIRDREYLEVRSLKYQEIEDPTGKAVRLLQWKLVDGRFDRPETDILIVLPGGYPDTRPDMFYTYPWLRLNPSGAYPKAADQPLTFGGITWQRWSRHSDDWRAGKDGIWTMIKRVEYAFENAT